MPPRPETAPRYAVIGAGAAGLCAAKYLREAGFEHVTIFEIGTRIGGLWCYDNDSGQSSAYRTLHINTPKHVTSFHDFPFADDVQTFPDHRDMHDYLTGYAEHFDLVRLIRFRSRVVDVRPATGYRNEAPRWDVEIEDGTVETFERVIVANGHLAKPSHAPELRDPFAGEYLHTHYYREPARFVGKRVCIVGVGNSACDIAADICMTAARTVLVARSGALIVPKLICGIPFHDIKLMLERSWLPRRLVDRLLAAMIYLIHGRMTDLGLKPMTKKAHGTSNPVVVQHIKYRRIGIKQGIERIEGRRIHFADGTSDEFDVLMAGTGYLIDLPFLADTIVPVRKNSVALYKRIVPPHWPGLYFIGLLNTGTVSLLDVHEHQMRWVLAFETGEALLPDTADMLADIVAKKALIERLYTHSPRHGIEEPYAPYYRELDRVRKDGAARLRRHGRPTAGGRSRSLSAGVESR
jgi:dimethylaniline monooxygenase (N-oxide forming)